MDNLNTLTSQVPTDCTYCTHAFLNDPWVIVQYGKDGDTAIASPWAFESEDIKKNEIKYSLENNPGLLRDFLLQLTPCALCPLLESGECEPRVLIENYKNGQINFFVAPNLNSFKKTPKPKGIVGIAEGLFKKQESRGEFTMRLEKQIITVAADNLDSTILKPIQATVVG